MTFLYSYGSKILLVQSFFFLDSTLILNFSSHTNTNSGSWSHTRITLPLLAAIHHSCSQFMTQSTIDLLLNKCNQLTCCLCRYSAQLRQFSKLPLLSERILKAAGNNPVCAQNFLKRLELCVCRPG